MSTTDEIHIDDVGTVFKATIVDTDDATIDISSATTKTITFRLPDGSTSVKSAEFFTDGTDGILSYTTVTNDLSLDGSWQIQAFVDLPTGEWYSSIDDFTVYPNL